VTRLAAYQGAPGAFGHEACRAFLPDYEPLPCESFAAVADAVAEGRADKGALPLRNTIAGEVPGNRALIDGRQLDVLAERPLPVRIHLLGLPGATLDGIRSVVSHPMALGQCRRFIAAHGLATVEETNTAIAARSLSASGDLSRGVLASERAAAVYGLVILQHDVHDRADNQTIFAIIARREDS
jgi:prephenate dehydratase